MLPSWRFIIYGLNYKHYQHTTCIKQNVVKINNWESKGENSNREYSSASGHKAVVEKTDFFYHIFHVLCSKSAAQFMQICHGFMDLSSLLFIYLFLEECKLGHGGTERERILSSETTQILTGIIPTALEGSVPERMQLHQSTISFYCQAPEWLSWLGVCPWVRSWSQRYGIGPASGSLLSGEFAFPSPSGTPLACALSLCQINK